MEACWRLFTFKMHAEVPNVYRLQLHLQGEHSITFREDNTIEEVEQKAGDSLKVALTIQTRHNYGHVVRRTCHSWCAVATLEGRRARPGRRRPRYCSPPWPILRNGHI